MGWMRRGVRGWPSRGTSLGAACSERGLGEEADARSNATIGC